jgi:hypothetical protein
MTSNPVSTALERVDAEPEHEFLAALRAQLLLDLERPIDPASAMPESADEYVALATDTSPVGPTRRALKMLIAVAACIAVFATAALIANRPANSADELSDVDLQEATPLGKAAFIVPADLGRSFRSVPPPDEMSLARAAAATAAVLPACAVLPSMGLLPPTTKAALPEQVLAGLGYVAHTVLVFASPDDASRAMDVIAGDVFRTCQLDMYDRLVPLGNPGVTSTTESWEAPAIGRHGDRQVIIGQHSRYVGGSDGPSEEFRVNVFVQVGRAISWSNPEFLAEAYNPRVIVDKAITATTAALENVFGS